MRCVTDRVVSCTIKVVRCVRVPVCSGYLERAAVVYNIGRSVQNLETIEIVLTSRSSKLKLELKDAERRYDAARSDVDRIYRARIKEKRESDVRRRVNVVYTTRDVESWIVDADEIARRSELFELKRVVERLTIRLNAVDCYLSVVRIGRNKLNIQLADYETIEDVEQLTEALKETNTLDMSRITSEVLSKIYKVTDQINETVARNEAKDEIDEAYKSSMQRAAPVVDEITRDIVEDILKDERVMEIA